LRLALGPLALTAGAAGGSSTAQSLCIAHHPQDFVWYTGSCTGHDEPEIDPLSTRPGSAQDLTWIVLPTNGAVQVDSVGPTFWIGGTVTDPNSITTGCTAGGGYNVTYSPNTYTACSPVWEVSKHGSSESAAFNALLTDAATGGPLVMHSGDTITDHQYATPAKDGIHITVTHLSTGHSGTIILNSKVDGPLMPAFDVQKLGNALSRGLVNDAPNSLVWEIGHTGNTTTPAGQFCLPGSSTKPPCYSYNISSWLGFQPLQIKSVTFGDGSSAQSWALVRDFGQALQFQQTKGCTSPMGGFPQYCSTALR